MGEGGERERKGKERRIVHERTKLEIGSKPVRHPPPRLCFTPARRAQLALAGLPREQPSRETLFGLLYTGLCLRFCLAPSKHHHHPPTPPEEMFNAWRAKWNAARIMPRFNLRISRGIFHDSLRRYESDRESASSAITSARR